ncbi:MAG: hypothetical protein ACUVX1_18145, partial [Chloroflexota bacterium]
DHLVDKAALWCYKTTCQLTVSKLVRVELVGDELDIRRYVGILAKRWATVRDAVILATLAALAFLAIPGSSSPTTYEALARLTVAKSMMQVTLDNSIKTLSPEPVAATQPSSANRRNTLAALVKSPSIAEDVVQKLGYRLPPALRTSDALLGIVEGRASKDADFIDIVVRGSDPAAVVEIANTWANTYERQANSLYFGQSALGTQVDDQLASARQEYEKASEALATFSGNNRILDLTLLIQDRKMQLSDIYGTRAKLQQILDRAKVLRNLGSESSADGGVALLLLKAQLASLHQAPPSSDQTTTSPPPANVQLQVSTAAISDSSPSELDAFIAALETQLAEFDEAINGRSSQLVGSEAGLGKQSALSTTIDRLNREIVELEAALDRESRQKRDLTLARDLAWRTYSSLATKAEEMTLATQLPNREVIVAALASTATPVGRQLSRWATLGLAAFIGLIVGVVGAFAVEHWSPEAPAVAIPWTAAVRWLRRRLAWPSHRPASQGPAVDRRG